MLDCLKMPVAFVFGPTHAVPPHPPWRKAYPPVTERKQMLWRVVIATARAWFRAARISRAPRVALKARVALRLQGMVSPATMPVMAQTTITSLRLQPRWPRKIRPSRLGVARSIGAITISPSSCATPRR